MFNKLLAAIVGRPEDGQRKMAVGVYVVSILAVLLIACVVTIAMGVGKSDLLAQIAEQAFTALTYVVAFLMGANGVEHIASAVTARKP